MLSQHKFPGTIVYAVLSGEEQGLLGGKILATMPRRRAGTSSPTSTTTSSATAAARTGSATTRPCASFPKARAGRGMRRSRLRNAASAARTTARRATSRASSTTWPSESRRSASTSARSGATTASAAAATIPNSSTPASRRCACRSRSRITTSSTRICGSRTASNIGDTIDEMDFPYLAQGHPAQRRRARRAGQRPAAARADGRRGGEHGYDGKLGSGARRSDLRVRWRRTDASGWEQAVRYPGRVCSYCPTRRGTDGGLQPMSFAASASTTGCSVSPRSARTASKARSPRRCRAGRSDLMRCRWRSRIGFRAETRRRGESVTPDLIRDPPSSRRQQKSQAGPGSSPG